MIFFDKYLSTQPASSQRQCLSENKNWAFKLIAINFEKICGVNLRLFTGVLKLFASKLSRPKKQCACLKRLFFAY